MPSRFKLTLAYDGASFEGFQIQGGHRTVQGEMERALRRLRWRGKHILSAARTDSGVHALGQVVAFDLAWPHSAADLARALNASLPQDMACREVEIVWPGFHPRFDAAARCYRYRIYQAPARDPLLDHFAWQVWPRLDLERVKRASRALVGEHDFHAFGSAPRSGGNTCRRVGRAEWETENEQLSFWIEADAFLFRMVRMTVGSLVRLGQGRMSEEEFLQLLREPRQGRAGPAAPARGLCLMGVEYAGRPEVVRQA